jgi:hypothetical protein
MRRSIRPKQDRAAGRGPRGVQILLPRLLSEMSPSASTSKGFLISGTRVAPSGVQFKQTFFRIRRLSYRPFADEPGHKKVAQPCGRGGSFTPLPTAPAANRREEFSDESRRSSSAIHDHSCRLSCISRWPASAGVRVSAHSATVWAT